MCVIYACYKGLPEHEELVRGAKRNSDGAGIAWIKDRRVYWEKGLKSDAEVIEKFVEAQGIKPPFAIHFRTASVGGRADELTHPFPIGPKVETWLEGNASAVLFHNGHVHDWEKHFMHVMYNTSGLCPDSEGGWSDSRALAYLVATKGEGVLHFVRGRSRVCIFKATKYKNPEHDEIPNMALHGDWIHDKTHGYFQSVSTYAGREVTPGKATGRGTMSPAAAGSGTTRAGSGTTSTGGGATSRSGFQSAGPSGTNVWTLEEIADVITQLEKEQEDAKNTLGIH